MIFKILLEMVLKQNLNILMLNHKVMGLVINKYYMVMINN